MSLRRGNSKKAADGARGWLGTLNISASYEWQKYYEQAILETDRGQLPKRIAEAQAAIDRRVEELRGTQIPHGNGGPDGHAMEEQALADALAGIRILVKEIS